MTALVRGPAKDPPTPRRTLALRLTIKYINNTNNVNLRRLMYVLAYFASTQDCTAGAHCLSWIVVVLWNFQQ